MQECNAFLFNLLKLILSSDIVNGQCTPIVCTTYREPRQLSPTTKLYLSKNTPTNIPGNSSNLHQACMHTANCKNNSSENVQSEF